MNDPMISPDWEHRMERESKIDDISFQRRYRQNDNEMAIPRVEPAHLPGKEMLSHGAGGVEGNKIGIPVAPHTPEHMPDMGLVMRSDNAGLENPFQSKAQMRAAFSGALGPKMKKDAKKWAHETKNIKKLPEHKKGAD